MPSGAEAKATGLEISSSMFSSMPQKRENGSSVSGMAPRFRKDSSDDEEECMGEREYWSPVPREVVGEELAGVVTERGSGGGMLGGRIAKGGGPRRVAGYKLSHCKVVDAIRTHAGRPCPNVGCTCESDRFSLR